MSMIDAMRAGLAEVGRCYVRAVTVVLVLMLIAGCAAVGGGTIGGRTADEAIGPATTPEARQCRLEILIAGVAIVMADRVTKDGDRFEAGTALTQLEELGTALANTRAADAVFRETELARARGALGLAVGSRLKDRVMVYLTGGVVGETQIVNGILAASTGAAVIADAARALQDMEAGRLDLSGCQAAVNTQLSRQRARLEAAARPR